MLKGGNWVLAKRLMDATPAFHWVRTGSFLCGVRESGPWCIESCNKVKAGLSSKMNGRYMQHVTIQNKVIHSAVLSVVNLHVLRGKNSTTITETKMQVQRAIDHLNDARVGVLIGDVNEPVKRIQSWIPPNWYTFGNGHDAISINDSGYTEFIVHDGLSADHDPVAVYKALLPQVKPLCNEDKIPQRPLRPVPMFEDNFDTTGQVQYLQMNDATAGCTEIFDIGDDCASEFEDGVLAEASNRLVEFRRYRCPTTMAYYWSQVDINTDTFFDGCKWYWEEHVEFRRYQCPMTNKYYWSQVNIKTDTFFDGCQCFWEVEEC